MNVIIKKRQLLVAALTVALGAAVLVNWYFTNSGDKKLADNTETTSGEYVQNLGEAKYVNAEGKQADLIVIDMNRPSMQPVINIPKNLVYSGSKDCVKMTMIAGRVLYENGEFFIGAEPEKIYAEVQSEMEKMLKE